MDRIEVLDLIRQVLIRLGGESHDPGAVENAVDVVATRESRERPRVLPRASVTADPRVAELEATLKETVRLAELVRFTERGEYVSQLAYSNLMSHLANVEDDIDLRGTKAEIKALDRADLRVAELEAENARLRLRERGLTENLTEVIALLDSAGLLNLAYGGVQLGQRSWYCKMYDAVTTARNQASLTPCPTQTATGPQEAAGC